MHAVMLMRLPWQRSGFFHLYPLRSTSVVTLTARSAADRSARLPLICSVSRHVHKPRNKREKTKLAHAARLSLFSPFLFGNPVAWRAGSDGRDLTKREEREPFALAVTTLRNAATGHGASVCPLARSAGKQGAAHTHDG